MPCTWWPLDEQVMENDMRTEASAGGVIVRSKRRSWQVLLMRDRKGNWTFPKGLIEGGEDASRTALREIQEELGLSQLRLLEKLNTIQYYYQREGLINKTVYYFLFLNESDKRLRVQKEEGITEARWLSFAVALRTIGYPKTNRLLLLEAQKFLSTTDYGGYKSSGC